jgi:hypothetical protein
MTTITIDDKLALRLRALREENDDFNQIVADALAETAHRWEWEAAGRAEMKKILEGPRLPADPEAAYQKSREKHGWAEDLSALTDEELADRYDAGLASLSPDTATEAHRMGLL